MIPVGVATVPVSLMPGERRPLDVNSINLQHIKNRLTLLSVCQCVGVWVCVCALVSHCGILLEPECCAFMCAPVVRCLPSCERAQRETEKEGCGRGKRERETEPEMCVSNCKHVRTAAQCGINFR